MADHDTRALRAALQLIAQSEPSERGFEYAQCVARAALAARGAIPQPAEPTPPRAERYLRRLLAARSGIACLYTDDGEAFGSEHGIQIDFMRDSVADIDAKLRALTVSRIMVAEAIPQLAHLTEQHVASLRQRIQADRAFALRFLVDAGICNADGTLAEQYGGAPAREPMPRSPEVRHD